MRTLRCLPFGLLLIFLLPLNTLLVAGQTTCAEASGTVNRVTYYSLIDQSEMVYSVYLPPCYDSQPDKTYPVIYLMHGSSSDDQHWIDLGLTDELDRGIVAGEIPPLIVIMPFGGFPANRNRFDDGSWENIFLTELMPSVETLYRIDARRESRAIGGISRGGFWAYSIGLRHSDLFSAIGGHSAFFDLDNAPEAFNPLDLAETAAVDGLRLWLDRGKNDYAAPNLEVMHQRLEARGVAHQYIVYPQGAHENAYWAAHIVDYLRFYTAGWQATTPQVAAIPATPGANRTWFLPVVNFFSTQTSIDFDQLSAVARGEFDPNLVIDSDTQAALSRYGVTLHPNTPVIAPDKRLSTLRNNDTIYTLLPFDQLTARYRILNIGVVHPLDISPQDYPLSFPDVTGNYDPSLLTRITMSGVTALARGTLEALNTHGTAWADEAIKPYVMRADVFHMSNETSFTALCPASDQPVLGSMCANEAHFDLLTDLGVDVVELTGNHNNDYGYDAYRHTLDLYRQQGIPTIGGGETLEDARPPYTFTHNGSSIALLACNWSGPDFALVTDDNPGAAFCEMDWLREELPALAAQYDLVIMTVQYGEYDFYRPPDAQRDHFRELAQLGADVVIGTQAHKPQTAEFYTTGTDQESFIHYGLGNLFFDQQSWEHTRFFMDQLFIYDGRLLGVDLFLGVIEDQGRPRPMTPEERQEFLDLMFVQMNGS